jgi:hypothetical protein
MAQQIYEPYEAKLYPKVKNSNQYEEIPSTFRCNVLEPTTASVYKPVQGIITDTTKKVIYTTSPLRFKVNDRIEHNEMLLKISNVALGENSVYSLGARKFSKEYLESRLPKWLILE